jgi:glyoxylase-like metal-dependent hydrolase (beta-lactamase superfamily II)
VLKLVHPKPAHTDGDTLVKWTKADILDMGDIYVRYGLPFVDTASGGHMEGFIRGVEKGISLCGPNTIVVPGHGDPATCKDLIEYRDKLRAIAENVRGQIKAGKTLEQIKATRPADGWTQPASAFVKPDAFVEMAYQSYAKAVR